MNKKIILLATILVTIIFVCSNFAQDKNKSVKQTTKNIDKSVVFNTVCPVSGETVDKKITYKYKDVTYALCCKTCLAKFKKEPEKYISRLNNDGKSIKKNK